MAYGVLAEYREKTGDETPAVFVSTASPFKFCADVLTSLGEKDVAPGLDALDQLTKVSGRPAPGPLAALRNKAVRFTDSVDKEKMIDVVLEMLK